MSRFDLDILGVLCVTTISSLILSSPNNSLQNILSEFDEFPTRCKASSQSIPDRAACSYLLPASALPCSNRFQQVPTGSNRFQQVPTGSNRFQQVPTGSYRFQQVPTGSNRFQQVPTGSNRFQQVPTGSNNQRFGVANLPMCGFNLFHLVSTPRHCFQPFSNMSDRWPDAY